MTSINVHCVQNMALLKTKPALYAMSARDGGSQSYQSRRISIHSMVSSTDGGQNHVELSPPDRTMRKSTLGLYTMNAGEGPLSYAQNSSYQAVVVDIAKPILEEEINKNLDLEHLSSNGLITNSFNIADFGCSTGHNSFQAIEIITNTIEKKFQSQPQITPDFHVFFNDQITNDFNTLLRSLPPERRYKASGVPGSFHGRLFPKASIHFGYSSWALQWLSEAPIGLGDEKSAAWNKGRVNYVGARREVLEAYSSRYAKDIESFLEARAEELVSGGLMALLVPAVSSYVVSSNTSSSIPTEIALIGTCLMDMAKEGRISEAKVNSFNFPLYFAIPQEVKVLIERSDKYSIERMEILNNPGKHTLASANARASFLRAAFEEVLISHFGSETMNELFYRYTLKHEASPALFDPDNDKTIMIFVVLKRK